MTKTYDGNLQSTYTLNNGRVIVLRDEEFVELFDGSSKYMELREKIIELECEVANRDKEICKLESESQEMLDIEEELKELQNKSCEWEQIDQYEDGFIYHTDCKTDWFTMDCNTPKENGMNYCPKCGGKIKIKEEK